MNPSSPRHSTRSLLERRPTRGLNERTAHDLSYSSAARAAPTRGPVAAVAAAHRVHYSLCKEAVCWQPAAPPPARALPWPGVRTRGHARTIIASVPSLAWPPRPTPPRRRAGAPGAASPHRPAQGRAGSRRLARVGGGGEGGERGAAQRGGDGDSGPREARPGGVAEARPGRGPSRGRRRRIAGAGRGGAGPHPRPHGGSFRRSASSATLLACCCSVSAATS
jgi:hypothetical protein